MIKYGVVSLDTFRNDLVSWNALYLSGRLHKPVDVFVESDVILAAQQTNLRHAVNVAALLAPESYSVGDMLKLICSLSYIGDIRLGFAEDSKKVDRIVTGELSRSFQNSNTSVTDLYDLDTLPCFQARSLVYLVCTKDSLTTCCERIMLTSLDQLEALA